MYHQPFNHLPNPKYFFILGAVVVVDFLALLVGSVIKKNLDYVRRRGAKGRK
jgi:hypothetical protein